MKEWNIDEFLKECEALCWNQYTYNYDNMPEGICNGHHVAPYHGQWHSIVIDGAIHSMACYSDKFPNGTTVYYAEDGIGRTALEDVRNRLERSKKC